MRNLIVPAPPAALSPEMFLVLQLCVMNKPLFPNLKTPALACQRGVHPIHPLFLSPQTIAISFANISPGLPKAMIASMITTLQTLCPNLQEIFLSSLPRDLMIIAAVSGMVLASNQDTLQLFHVDAC